MEVEEFLNYYNVALKELEEYVRIRRYNDTPYQQKTPKIAMNDLKNTLKPFIDTLDINKIRKYFNKNKFEIEYLSIYIKYRYLLYFYKDYIDKKYEEDKKTLALWKIEANEKNNRKFSHIPLEYWIPRSKNRLMIFTNKEEPKNIRLCEYMPKNFPNFEHDELFTHEQDNEEIIIGINNLLYENKFNIKVDCEDFKFVKVDSIFLNEKSFKKFKKFTGCKVSFGSDGYIHNLYNYIYDNEIINFLEEYKDYFYSCDMNLIYEFFEKTNMKIKYIVSDKYRRFYFDMYGVYGNDCETTVIYNDGDYRKCFDYDEIFKMRDDYDICVEINFEHVNYDEDKNIYYQTLYDKWDPIYESLMDEEEINDFGNKESKRIYIYYSKNASIFTPCYDVY